VSGYSRIRRQQLLQEAQGYLDLIMAVPEQDTVRVVHCSRLAQRALEALDQLDRNDCASGRVHFLRGQAYRLMEKHDLALNALQKSSEYDPHNVRILLAQAWCFKRLGRLDLAIESLEDALEIQGDVGILHYNLACYWSLLGNVGLSLVHLSRAIDLNADYRQLVASEHDFDGLRSHPEFQTLTNVSV